MTVSAASPPTRPRRSRRAGHAYLLVLPYAVLLLLVGILPALYALLTSFFDLEKAGTPFRGLFHYQTAFSDFRFTAALGHVLAFLGLWLPAMLVGVPGIALLLHVRPSRFTEAMRLVYYLPSAVTGSASVLVWIFMFTPQLSPFGPLLKLLGFSSVSSVLATPNLPLAFALMAFVAYSGYWVVVVYGALQGISPEVLEAAVVDGCTAWQLALRVKLPLITRYLTLMLILSFAGGFQLFVEPQVIYSASLSSLSNPAWSLSQLAYSFAFQMANFSASAALSIGLLVVSLSVALFVIYRTDFYRTDGGDA